MKKIAVWIVTTFVATMTLTAPAMAQINVFPNCSGAAASSEICKARDDKLFGPGSIWNRVLNVLTYVIGAVAVLMIIIGGLKYVTSQGSDGEIQNAKNTILYAVVGLVLAVSANLIVNFVLTNI